MLVAARAYSQVKQYPLQSTDGLTLHNVAVEPVTLQGRTGLKLTMSEQARREQRQVEQLARIKDVEFSNGVIEVELAGATYAQISVDDAVTDGNFVTAPAWPAHPAWMAQFLAVLGTRIEHA